MLSTFFPHKKVAKNAIAITLYLKNMYQIWYNTLILG